MSVLSPNSPEGQNRRRSVAGIALENGAIFTARRKPGGDLGGKWEFPGGKVRAGESDRETLIREFDEELSAAVEPGRALGETSFTHKGILFTLAAYEVRFLNKNFSLNEHTEYRWVSFGELEALDFAESDRALFPALKKLLYGSRV